MTRAFPWLATRLMRRALSDWPIAFAEAPQSGLAAPAVSFVMGHRGIDRVPLLLSTLRTIAAQAGPPIEAIVVEQAPRPDARDALPPWVRYVHTPPPTEDYPYNRSWALNVGAEAARGELLVLHDGDMLVPRDYAAQLLARHSEGFDTLNLKRLIFYLSRGEPTQSGMGTPSPLAGCPEEVIQNLEGGGSLAVSRRVFDEIGGFDEEFLGWGGEDVEFWERATTRPTWRWGYLPIVHLWHPPQEGRATLTRGIERHRQLQARPVAERITVLCARRRGQPSAPYTERGNDDAAHQVVVGPEGGG